MQQTPDPLSYITGLHEWIGRSEVQSDVVSEAPVTLLAATLDRQSPPRVGNVLPYTWHWLYFLPATRQRDLGEDGHPRRGMFMPPVPLPRRMWAGSRIEFRHPLHIGEPIRRRATIADVQGKMGRGGPLVFVHVTYEIENARGVAIVEERDIVYRDADTSNAKTAPQKAPHDAQWVRRHVADPVLLFRYSALTFNSHRIHYDSRYATQVERYPGLVVHGPLLATLIAEFAAEKYAGRAIRHVSFRALSPIFSEEPFVVAGKGEENHTALWVANVQGDVAMSAEANFA